MGHKIMKHRIDMYEKCDSLDIYELCMLALLRLIWLI